MTKSDKGTHFSNVNQLVSISYCETKYCDFCSDVDTCFLKLHRKQMEFPNTLTDLFHCRFKIQWHVERDSVLAGWTLPCWCNSWPLNTHWICQFGFILLFHSDYRNYNILSDLTQVWCTTSVPYPPCPAHFTPHASIQMWRTLGWSVPATSWRGSRRIFPVPRRCSICTYDPETLSSATASRSSQSPCYCSSAGPWQSRQEIWSWSCRRRPERRRAAPRSSPHSWTSWQLGARSPQTDPDQSQARLLLLSSPEAGVNALELTHLQRLQLQLPTSTTSAKIDKQSIWYPQRQPCVCVYVSVCGCVCVCGCVKVYTCIMTAQKWNKKSTFSCRCSLQLRLDPISSSLLLPRLKMCIDSCEPRKKLNLKRWSSSHKRWTKLVCF